MSITSDEVNYLIYRYLQESGFTHSTFAFAHESHLVKTDLKNMNVSPGALVNILQKGLLYMEAESAINEDGSEKEFTRPFSILHLNNADSLKSNKKKQERLKLKKKEIELMDIDDRKEVALSLALHLQGHSSEVFNARWHPFLDSFLLSGAGDSTARIWSIPLGSVDAKTTCPDPIILQHQDITGDSKDLTAVLWSNSSEYIVTATYHGMIKLWKSNGQLIASAKKHKGPVFSASWNKSDTILLTAGFDKTVLAWSIPQLEVLHVYSHHSGPVLDVEWKDDVYFASCSGDKTVCVSSIENKEHLIRMEGHLNEINAISWCPSNRFIASCSDDKSIKIWKTDEPYLVADLKGHSKEVYTIEWRPAGPGSKNPNLDLLLASASKDNSVRIWDPSTSRCLRELRQHTQAVYSVAFSPCGKYLASGGFDGRVVVWNVDDGGVVRTFKNNSGVFEVSWNSSGTKIAAAFSKHTVCVFDFVQ